MILRADIKLEVGKHYVDRIVTDGNSLDTRVSFIVVEEVTKEDFINQCNMFGVKIGPLTGQFYRVLMD